MTTERRVVVAAVLAAVLAGATLATCLVRHERARSAWTEMSTRVEGPGYSGDRSDALYREVDVLRERTSEAAWATALAACLVAGALGAARGPVPGARRGATAALLLTTTGLDAAVTLATLGVALGARDLGLGSPAVDDTLALVVPALAVSACMFVAARGETPGTLTTRIEHARWSAVLAPVVVLALVLTLASPLTALAALASRAARPGLLAPHLAAIGAARNSDH